MTSVLGVAVRSEAVQSRAVMCIAYMNGGPHLLTNFPPFSRDFLQGLLNRSVLCEAVCVALQLCATNEIINAGIKC